VKISNGNLHLQNTDLNNNPAIYPGIKLNVDSFGILTGINNDSFLFEFGRNSKSIYSLNTVTGLYNNGAMSYVGNATQPPSATSILTRHARILLTSTTAASTTCVARSTNLVLNTGVQIGRLKIGGFYNVIKFGIIDNIANARFFVGMTNTTSAPTLDVSTMPFCLGVGSDSSSLNMKIFANNSVVNQPIDLGVDFPKSANNMYELKIYSIPKTHIEGTVSVIIQLKNILTGITAKVHFTQGARIPGNTIFLNPIYSFRKNSHTATTPASYAIYSQYAEANSL
jgi:hypothetical protein